MLVLLVSLPHLEHGITLSWPNAFAAQLSSENSTLFNNHQLHFTPLEMDMVGKCSVPSLIEVKRTTPVTIATSTYLT